MRSNWPPRPGAIISRARISNRAIQPDIGSETSSEWSDSSNVNEELQHGSLNPYHQHQYNPNIHHHHYLHPTATTISTDSRAGLARANKLGKSLICWWCNAFRSCWINARTASILSWSTAIPAAVPPCFPTPSSPTQRRFTFRSTYAICTGRAFTYSGSKSLPGEPMP